MAMVLDPAIHQAERVKAWVLEHGGDPECKPFACLHLNVSGRDDQVARLTVYFEPAAIPYAHALADAINAVPVPEKLEETV